MENVLKQTLVDGIRGKFSEEIHGKFARTYLRKDLLEEGITWGIQEGILKKFRDVFLRLSFKIFMVKFNEECQEIWKLFKKNNGGLEIQKLMDF